MKMRDFIFILIILFTLLPCYADNQVRITGGTCFDLSGIPDFEMITGEMSDSKNSRFWGIGWEVILDKLGLGGNYYTDFIQDINLEWTVAWYSEVFYLSYHILGAGAFVDPFIQTGLGCVGGVYVGDKYFDSSTGRLAMALFPFVSAGLVFDFDGFLIGAKLNYAPVMKPIPVTDIELYSIKSTQFIMFAGISFGGHD